MTEKGDAVGDWNQIGYSAPGERVSTSQYKSSNFQYDDTETTKGKKYMWSASNLNNLNECTTTIGGEKKGWTITAEPGEANATTGANGVKITVGGADLCKALTPSFDNLATPTTSSTADS